MKGLQVFFFLYVVVVALLYALGRRTGPPFLLPGDIYISKGSRIYIPLGASLIVTVLLFLVLYALIPR
ncbi:hypothetical protein A2962_04840 [Candidatus Woesebacteria bacterium RIFCSPLOWO2_01_FULL_39_61]|uniref:DUF2905 domain-containing protein n=1 Tax=Candidatus Woesebacteria bacterium RIFCSPHIGHO2_02_FULL_39_13 TaxID=1802505 RepID=A0A1F7Z3Q4_9BACT|nr:MAG: hypothetical protein A2692_00805 [Candidatus Woesebacteria bacterium RIFCSPHIGHO2_01_FULL_39_95]OGM34242.1 MAG: hypothetical protein A3D01_01830 [Candidatus Woesebacteria bacterium RIFCSPHIGHO2_02_FULL_39_13]OGM38587.1 MAG: hypothetical protein A3E13_00350 [Candidatus Woesebacteria bacterium RIFCSPHIGHO2_12_FULL_40_20]OGM67072.1 MAG: hypothetical protein A2962_04840 [Candidatus Woesebacteria bacterium RIFCSPLOWO2_01_FULL_39_61]OGM71717.1 MAG: hypothetical protein A3H19_03440 [Candidatus